MTILITAVLYVYYHEGINARIGLSWLWMIVSRFAMKIMQKGEMANFRSTEWSAGVEPK